MPTFQEEQDALLAEEEAAAQQEAYQGDAQQSPFDNFPSRPYQSDQEQQQPISEIQPPPAPEQPQSAPEPYQGQAYPGLPVIQDRGSGPGGADQFTYNGEIVPSEQAAFAARARDAANPQAQQAFQAAEEQRAQVRAQAQPGEPDPSQMTSIQLRAEMDKHTLSRSDQLELTQLQNGAARIQRDAREGRLPIAEAIRIERELRARMQPMMITMQQFHALQMALDYKIKQEHLQQMSQANTQANLFTAAHAPGTTIPLRDENGRLHAQVIIDGQGRMHTVSVPREPAPARQAAPERSQITSASILQSLRPHGGSSGESAGAGGGDLSSVPTEAQLNAAVELHGRVDELVHQQREEQQRRTPGGPLPFDPLPPNRTPSNWTEAGQQMLNAAALHADENSQTDRSRVIRSVAGALRGGATTGQLTPEQQQTLHEIGYYHGEFTPALDRELGRIEKPPVETLVNRGTDSGQNVTVRKEVAPAVGIATRGIRNLLGQYGSLAAMPPTDRQAFQIHLATIRVFQWGRTQDEASQSRRGPNDSPAGQGRPAPTPPQVAEQRRQEAAVQGFTSGI